MSKPPHPLQILRLRRLKHWSVPGIAKHLGVEQALVRGVLWPQPGANRAATEPALVAALPEPPGRGHPLQEPIVRLYQGDRLSASVIAQVLGVSQALVLGVLRGAGYLHSNPPVPRFRRFS